MKRKRSITRREFLKGANAAAAAAAVMGILGGYGTADVAAAAEAPVPPPAAPLPEPSPTPPQPAVPAAGPSNYEGGARVLAFASDQHAETPGFAAWLGDQQAVYGEDLELLTYGGDICDKSWNQEVFEGFRSVLESAVPGRYVVTTGNQEHKAGAPAWDGLGAGFLRIGEAVRTEDYIVYCFGAAGEQMAFPQEDIDALAAYLADAPNNIPIFVVSHYPLHLSVPYASHDIPGGVRQTRNSDKLVGLLNKHPNVVFFWGHNHTFQDPRYGTIRPAGSRFTWDSSDVTQKLTVNFTYANLGSFCRGDTYGCIAELRRDGDSITVKLYYVDTNIPMLTRESAVLVFTPDGAVRAEVQTSESTDYVDMFYLAGWYEDPGFAEDY